MLRFLTAGESHGKSLTVIIEGLPANVPLRPQDIDRDLARRQISYGRGKRMEIEDDRVEITSGVRFGQTLGSPVALVIANKDWVNWQTVMSVDEGDRTEERMVTCPRPGHADLVGAAKYNQKDMRNILERSSARETAARVAVGAVCKAFLKKFDIFCSSYTRSIGEVIADHTDMTFADVIARSEASDMHCADMQAAEKMKQYIDKAREQGDTVGGVAEMVVMGVPPGLGSHVHWDRKLDGRIAQSLMSIQAVKAVEVGLGLECASSPGSQVHDEIFFRTAMPDQGSWGFVRETNRAGGIEGGMSNGEPIVVRAAMKPISTLMKPLKSVDMMTKEPVGAAVERSDVCRVPSLGVIGEAAVAYEITQAFLEKFGGDSLEEIKSRYELYIKALKEF